MATHEPRRCLFVHNLGSPADSPAFPPSPEGLSEHGFHARLPSNAQGTATASTQPHSLLFRARVTQGSGDSRTVTIESALQKFEVFAQNTSLPLWSHKEIKVPHTVRSSSPLPDPRPWWSLVPPPQLLPWLGFVPTSRARNSTRVSGVARGPKFQGATGHSPGSRASEFRNHHQSPGTKEAAPRAFNLGPNARESALQIKVTSPKRKHLTIKNSS